MDPDSKPAEAQAPAQAAARTYASPAAPAAPAPMMVPLSEFDRIRAEHAALAAELKKRDAETTETKSLLAQLQEKVALTEKERETLRIERERDAVRYAARMAAVEQGAIDPDDVVALTAGAFKVADGKVVAEDGSDPAAFVKAFLEKKPHLAKPRIAPGSGASPFPAAAPQAPAQSFDLTTREGATAALRTRLLALAGPATAQPTEPNAAGRGVGR